MPPAIRETYHRASIEKRLKSTFYRGQFNLKGDPTVYQGKHELIIPKHHLDAVKAINEGRMPKRSPDMNGKDIFRGWLLCGHPECQRLITFENKKKVLKTTGEVKYYPLYRCSNSRRVHKSKQYFSEEKIWEQLAPAVAEVAINEEFAKDITDALNETHHKQKAAIKLQMEGFRNELKGLEGKEDELYRDLKKGVLNESGYERQIARVRSDRQHYTNEIERLTLTISDEAMVSVKKVFELAINAKELFKSLSREDRVEYLKKVCSNPRLDGLTLQYQLKSPFKRLSDWKEKQDWRRM